MNPKIKRLANITRQELTPFIQGSHCFDSDWGCSCLVCSWLLEKVLKAHGIDCDLCIGNWDGLGHAFIMIDDSVVDITATQFKQRPIHIVKLKGFKYTIDLLGRHAHLDIKNWPDEQNPRRYKHKLAVIFKQIMKRTL